MDFAKESEPAKTTGRHEHLSDERLMELYEEYYIVPVVNVKKAQAQREQERKEEVRREPL